MTSGATPFEQIQLYVNSVGSQVFDSVAEPQMFGQTSNCDRHHCDLTVESTSAALKPLVAEAGID